VIVDLAAEASEDSSDDEEPTIPFIETEPNSMGLFRRYTVLPSTDPDRAITIHHVADAPTFIKDPNLPQPNPVAGFGPETLDNIAPTASISSSTPYFAPFLNATVFRLMCWFYSSATKTLADLQNLVDQVILHPDFHAPDLTDFSATRESRRMDKSGSADVNLPYRSSDIWTESTITVPLPLVHRRYPREDNAEMLPVKFFHRDLTEVVKSAVQDFVSHNFHWQGFQQMWQPSENEPAERVYGEFYTSDRYLEMQQNLPNIPGCTLEKAVVSLMVYSDSTHLADFGTASLWPMYIWFGVTTLTSLTQVATKGKDLRARRE
jgi:hypothetical protein